MIANRTNAIPVEIPPKLRIHCVGTIGAINPTRTLQNIPLHRVADQQLLNDIKMVVQGLT